MLFESEILLSISDGDIEFMQELISIYIEDNTPRVQNIQKSFQEDEHESLEKEAHTLKGASANIGAIAIQNISQEIEMAARDRRSGEIAELISSLPGQFAKTCEELQNFLKEQVA